MYGESHDGSTVNQVHGVQNNHFHQSGSIAGEPPDAGPATAQSQSSGSSGKVAFFVALCVAAWVIAHALGLTDKSIPTDGAKTPDTARTSALSLIRRAIENCAKATVPQPVNCPQSDNRATSTSLVKWTLYGDPTDGEVDDFKNDTVYVQGIAIMTIQADPSATLDGNALFDIKRIGYYSEVRWNDGHAQLAKLSASRAHPPKPIKKRSATFDENSVFQQVESFLKACATSRSAFPPAQCPAHFVPDLGPAPQDPHWKVQDDPMLNARSALNRDSGLIEVTGQLRIALYDGPKVRSVFSAPYKAELFPKSTKTPEVLRIAMES